MIKKSDFKFKFVKEKDIKNWIEGRLCVVSYKDKDIAEIKFDYDDIVVSFLDEFVIDLKDIDFVDYYSYRFNDSGSIDKKFVKKCFFESDVFRLLNKILNLA